MLENLTKRLDAVLLNVRGKGLLTAEHVDEALKEVRLAFLEADVHFKVVKTFIEAIRAKAIGKEVLESLSPGQQIVKIVSEELTQLLGEQGGGFSLASKPPTIVLLVGLQGSGKTTTAGKLGRFYKREGRRVLLVAADLQRPAAIEQLQTLGKNIEVAVVAPVAEKDPLPLIERGIAQGRAEGCDLIIIDTAGRLQIDERLMDELVRIKSKISPHEILLVADAMTGQTAVNVAEAFHKKLDLTGIVLTKTEGDARGGALLSIRSITGAAVKFIGTGEKLDAFEPFYPDRMASRILGMGDVLSLIEMAEKNYSREQAESLAKKVRSDQFTLADFGQQLKQIKKLGSFEKIIEMIPGMRNVKALPDQGQMEKEMKQVEAIISSMTPEERRDPGIINGSRRKRISKGSGSTPQDINRLLKQFYEAKKMMKLFSGAKRKGLGKMSMPF